jgi:uncharacterized membrane protein AbrB (regulator of aidB expression)
LIKNVIFAFLQFVLFSFAYVAGTILPPFGLLPSHVSTWADGTKFEWDGVFMALALLIVILLIETIRKRLRTAAPWTTLALALAAIVEFVIKLGVTSPSR